LAVDRRGLTDLQQRNWLKPPAGQISLKLIC
jgi:hypothetical protein